MYGIVQGEKARYYEAEQMPKIKHSKIGLISMVNCGDNMLGSQFYITLGSELQSLDNEHCIFGEIAEGLEVIQGFNKTICDKDHRPYQDIRISHTVILEDPFDDPVGLVVPDASPEPTQEFLMVCNRIIFKHSCSVFLSFFYHRKYTSYPNSSFNTSSSVLISDLLSR